MSTPTPQPSALFPSLAALPRRSVLKAEPATDVLVLIAPSGDVVLKVYRQPRWLRWRTWLMPSRAAREWRNLDRVRRAGVACVEALAWDEVRRRGCVRESGLVTRLVAGAPSLKEVLGTVCPPRARRSLARALGHLVRTLHETGFVGARMTPRNVLVTGDLEAPRLVLLDLPAALAFGASIVATGRADLDLWDAALSPGRSRHLSRPERLRVLLAYHADERAAARASWRRLARRPRWNHEVRKAFWVGFCNYALVAWHGLTGRRDRLVPMRDFDASTR